MKKIVLFVICGILLIAIPLAVYVVGKNTELRKRAAPATTLTFSPSQETVQINQTFPLEIKINTADNQVATIQLQAVFDPTKFQAIDITNGDLAPTIRVSGKVDDTGTATITVGAKDETHPITGIGTVAVLTLKAISATATPATIQFSPAPNTFINALGEGESNVLTGSTPANITITNIDNSTTQTASESATQDASASASATPTPTQTPDVTPTLTPTPTDIQNQNANQGTQTLQITSPTDNENVTNVQPSFSGTAAPGATVTLTIHSTPQTDVVTADANGNWTYTPTTPLDAGQHSVTALTTDPTSGATQTTTTSFTVNIDNSGTGKGSGVTTTPTDNSVESTGSAVPETGTIETTFILIFIGGIIFLGGALLPVLTQ